jgi:ATP-dependent Clp protease adaptor protein ClpS
VTTTITRKTPRERSTGGGGSGLGPPWRVVVLNDHHNTFEGVAFALANTLPGISYERGLGMADRIHNTGSAVVWSGHRELAELYWSRLRDQGLTMGPLER